MIDLEKHKRLEAEATAAPWVDLFSGEPPLQIGNRLALISFSRYADVELVLQIRNDHAAMVAEIEHLRRPPDWCPLPRFAGWQPIETAPKDSTLILAAIAGKTVPFTCWWSDDASSCQGKQPGWIDGSHNKYEEYYVHFPTHWMPLPEPPVEVKP